MTEKHKTRKLIIPIPNELYSRELLRVFSNNVHGELVVTVSGKGELNVTAYQPEEKRARNGNLEHKTYLINHKGKVVSGTK